MSRSDYFVTRCLLFLSVLSQGIQHHFHEFGLPALSTALTIASSDSLSARRCSKPTSISGSQADNHRQLVENDFLLLVACTDKLDSHREAPGNTDYLLGQSVSAEWVKVLQGLSEIPFLTPAAIMEAIEYVEANPTEEWDPPVLPWTRCEKTR